MNLRVSIYSLLLIGLIISPIFFLQLTIEPSQVPRFAYLSLVLLGFNIWILNSNSKLFLPKKAVLVPLVLFYLINLTSCFWSLNFAEAIYESQKILLFILILVTGASLIKMESNKVLCRSALIGLYGLIIIALIDINLSSNLENPDSLVLFGHKNILSAILMLSAVLTTLAYYHLKKFHLVFILALLLAIGLIILFQTRSVFLALAINSILLLIFTLTKLKIQYKSLLIITLVLFMLGITALVIFASKDVTSLSERFMLWEKSYLLFKENPFLGVGTGNWQFNYSQFGVSEIDRSFHYNVAFKRPHNDFISIITETGILGLIPILWVFIWGIRTLASNLKNINLSDLLIIIGLIGYLVFANFSFPKERVILVVLLAILFLGFLYKNDSLVELNSGASDKLSLISVVLIIGLLTMSFYRIKGEFHTKQLLENQELGKGLYVIEQSKKAQSIFYSVDPTGTPIKSYEGWGYDEITDLPELLKANEEAVTLCPYNYQVLSNYGYVLQRSLRFKDAEKVLMYSYEINEKYEPTLLNLSVLHFNLGHYEIAMKWLKKIKDHQIKYPENYTRISDAIVQSYTDREQYPTD